MGQDTETILSNPIGQPMAAVSQYLYDLNINILITSQIIFNSLGKRGTLTIWSLIVITMYAEKRILTN